MGAIFQTTVAKFVYYTCSLLRALKVMLTWQSTHNQQIQILKQGQKFVVVSLLQLVWQHSLPEKTLACQLSCQSFWPTSKNWPQNRVFTIFLIWLTWNENGRHSYISHFGWCHVWCDFKSFQEDYWAKWDFHQILIMMEKSSLKGVPPWKGLNTK